MLAGVARREKLRYSIGTSPTVCFNGPTRVYSFRSCGHSAVFRPRPEPAHPGSVQALQAGRQARRRSKDAFRADPASRRNCDRDCLPSRPRLRFRGALPAPACRHLRGLGCGPRPIAGGRLGLRDRPARRHCGPQAVAEAQRSSRRGADCLLVGVRRLRAARRAASGLGEPSSDHPLAGRLRERF